VSSYSGYRRLADERGHRAPDGQLRESLYKGLKGIRAEVEHYLAEVDQPYDHYSIQGKKDFYKAVLILSGRGHCLRQALRPTWPKKKPLKKLIRTQKELERIAEVCAQVPANPARNCVEAIQSVWMIHVIITSELSSAVHCFGRFDQYMYPFYKKSVLDEKTMTHDQALELLEMFWIRTNGTGLRSYESVKNPDRHGLGNNLTIGGQTSDGKDACNEVTTLCLEADEELGVLLPETGMRIWSGTPDKYLRKACEVVPSWTRQTEILWR